MSFTYIGAKQESSKITSAEESKAKQYNQELKLKKETESIIKSDTKVDNTSTDKDKNKDKDNLVKKSNSNSSNLILYIAIGIIITTIIGYLIWLKSK